jgi:hypothetical protein
MKIGDKILITDGTGPVISGGWVGTYKTVTRVTDDARFPFQACDDNKNEYWVEGVPSSGLVRELL